MQDPTGCGILLRGYGSRAASPQASAVQGAGALGRVPRLPGRSSIGERWPSGRKRRPRKPSTGNGPWVRAEPRAAGRDDAQAACGRAAPSRGEAQGAEQSHPLAPPRGSMPRSGAGEGHHRPGWKHRGEVAEWSKAAVLKTVDRKRSVGSNPTLSAKCKRGPSRPPFTFGGEGITDTNRPPLHPPSAASPPESAPPAPKATPPAAPGSTAKA